MVSLSPLTAKNIHRHELIGLNVEIIKSTDKNLIGMQGCIVDETKQMLVIDLIGSKSNTTASRRVSIEKKNSSFRFQLPNEELVDVDGSLLNSKSENRIKNVIRKRW